MDLAARYARLKAALPAGVRLVAVSKTRTVEEIRALYDLGHRAFGENYPQEMKAKQARLPADIEWHFIGHLQRGNVKHVAPFVHLIHGVDGEKLLDEIEKRAAAAGRVIDVLFEVHVARESTKHGLTPEELNTLASAWPSARWPHVRVRGLMGMATFTEDNALIGSEFDRLAGLFRSLRSGGPFDPALFDILSMGMSADFGIAIARGSTLVRIGTALFGPRS